MIDETEAQEGKSLEEPTDLELLEQTYDKLEKEDEPEDEAEEKVAEADEPDSEESDDEETPDDPEQEEPDSEEAEELKVEEHLPEDFRDAVKEMDEDVAKIVLETVKTSESRANSKFEESAEARKFYEDVGVDRIKPILEQSGQSPSEYYNRIMGVEQAFRTQPDKTIAAMILEAKRTGTTDFTEIQKVMGVAPKEDDYQDPDIKGLRDEVSGLRDRLQQRELASEQQLSNEGIAHIENFKNEAKDGEPTHPHFSKVERSMGALMQTGQARDMQEAYEKAVRMDPELYQGILKANEQSVIKEQETKRKDSVKKSKSASRNAKGKKPSSPENNYPDDDLAVLNQVYDELEAG